MLTIPGLYTPRLCLRPFSAADAARVQELAGDGRIAATTLHVPHPYPEGAAEEWIDGHAIAAAMGKSWEFAITLTGTRTPGRERDVGDTGHVIGTVGIFSDGDRNAERAQIGYWIGVPYWGKGFATEAAHAALRFGFMKLKFNRVFARHFAINPASGRVMRKLGMTQEGVLREHEVKSGVFLDVAVYGLLRREWQAKERGGRPRVFTQRVLEEAIA